MSLAIPPHHHISSWHVQGRPYIHMIRNPCNTRIYTITVPTNTRKYIEINLYRVSQEECARLREGVPYVKVYRYNPKHLCPKLNGYGDNDQRSLKL